MPFIPCVRWSRGSSAARNGTTELHVAFSQMQAHKVYVQDLLRAQRERVWALLQQGAVVYVCGDASRMEPDVRKALADIAMTCGGLDEAAARQHVEQLAAQRRYLVDMWAAGQDRGAWALAVAILLSNR